MHASFPDIDGSPWTADRRVRRAPPRTPHSRGSGLPFRGSCSDKRLQGELPRTGGTERARQLDEPRRRKDRRTESEDRSEPRESSRRGLSSWSQYLQQLDRSYLNTARRSVVFRRVRRFRSSARSCPGSPRPLSVPPGLGCSTYDRLSEHRPAERAVGAGGAHTAASPGPPTNRCRRGRRPLGCRRPVPGRARLVQPRSRAPSASTEDIPHGRTDPGARSHHGSGVSTHSGGRRRRFEVPKYASVEPRVTRWAAGASGHLLRQDGMWFRPHGTELNHQRPR